MSADFDVAAYQRQAAAMTEDEWIDAMVASAPPINPDLAARLADLLNLRAVVARAQRDSAAA